MLSYFLTKIFGNKNQRELRQLSAVVRQITLMEASTTELTDQALGAKTEHLRDMVRQ